GAEALQPLGALLQLAERLRTAEHQDRQQRDLLSGETESLVEQMPVLERTAARSAREPRPPSTGHPVERGLDRPLVVVDDRIAVGRLTTGETERVQRQRIGIRCRALLLDQAAEDADLDGVGVHGAG